MPHYPELLEVLYHFRTRTWNFWEFCKIPIPLPGTSVISVRLWSNTRDAGMPLLQHLGGALYPFRFYPKSALRTTTSYLVSHTNRTPNSSTYHTIIAPALFIFLSFLSARINEEPFCIEKEYYFCTGPKGTSSQLVPCIWRLFYCPSSLAACFCAVFSRISSSPRDRRDTHSAPPTRTSAIPKPRPAWKPSLKTFTGRIFRSTSAAVFGERDCFMQ